MSQQIYYKGDLLILRKPKQSKEIGRMYKITDELSSFNTPFRPFYLLKNLASGRSTIVSPEQLEKLFRFPTPTERLLF